MKIIELVLYTNKLQELYDFYSNVLEMQAADKTKKQFVVHTPGTKITWVQAFDGNDPIYHFAFNIPCNKIDEAYEWLKQKVSLLWMDDYNSYIADFVNWHAKSVYFLDAAGNVVEFIARFDLNDRVEEQFSVKHIRNVSEIGLVLPSDEFDTSLNKLMQKYQLSYFDKQPPLPQFRAIGNDEGLFIVVPENRPWFPTKNIQSGIFPMRVRFRVDDSLHEIVL